MTRPVIAWDLVLTIAIGVYLAGAAVTMSGVAGATFRRNRHHARA
jgi:hypothetical protein